MLFKQVLKIFIFFYSVDYFFTCAFWKFVWVDAQDEKYEDEDRRKERITNFYYYFKIVTVNGYKHSIDKYTCLYT